MLSLKNMLKNPNQTFNC